MRKEIGKWFYMAMLALGVFAIGFFVGNNTRQATQITIINAEETDDSKSGDMKDPAASAAADAMNHVDEVVSEIDAEPLLIDLNTASVETLDMLPGIGPAYAQRIVDYRQANGPFESIEDITKVSGIGEKTFEKIKDLITVEGMS